jgi:Ca-activated chloride channel homolog
MNDTIFRFLQPWVLFFLVLPPLFLAWELWRRRSNVPSVLYSDLSLARGLPKSLKQKAGALFPWVRFLVLVLGIIALARPQFGTIERRVGSLGVDISLVLDVSNSMQQPDFVPNRLEAAKEAAIEFIKNRETDRVSVIIFGKDVGVLLPPTLDMSTAEMFIQSVYDGILDNTATAIGDGLGMAVKKMEDSTAKSRVVILLTDGDNNAGKLKPMQAAEVAKSLDVRVYTIGVGSIRTRGRLGAFGPISGMSFDETTLKKIANLTGGKYYRATDKETLKGIYREIDEMEKTEVKVDETASYNEQFHLLWLPALFLLGLEIFLRAFWIGRLP